MSHRCPECNTECSCIGGETALLYQTDGPIKLCNHPLTVECRQSQGDTGQDEEVRPELGGEG